MQIDVSNRQTILAVDPTWIETIVKTVLSSELTCDADISVALVDDAAIHQLNRQYLRHDYPTDVLAFVLDRTDELLTGQIVVSTETAVQVAGQVRWDASSELALYVIHASLHLAGLRDKSAEEKLCMREREQYYLHSMGIIDVNESVPADTAPTTEAQP